MKQWKTVLTLTVREPKNLAILLLGRNHAHNVFSLARDHSNGREYLERFVIQAIPVFFTRSQRQRVVEVWVSRGVERRGTAEGTQCESPSSYKGYVKL